MIIRKAEFADKKYILEIISLLNFSMPEFIWSDDQFVEKQIENGEYFLAEIDNRVAGIISFRQRRDRMYIETLAVAEEYRSRGIGTQLVEFVENFTQEKGLRVLCVCSFYEYKAQDFYLKLGFSLLNGLGKYKNYQYQRFEKKL